MSDFQVRDVGFGDYVKILQKRYGVPDEKYIYKVINLMQSNVWVDVPVHCPDTEVKHDKIEIVISCICCGVDETEVLKFRLCDVELIEKPDGFGTTHRRLA